jgi:hypothetical protein
MRPAHLGKFLTISCEISLKFELDAIHIRASTDVQYSEVNKKNVCLFKMMAAIIQPRLKTEESLRISSTFFLFTCNAAPLTMEATINVQVIVFNWYRIRKIGASFCHVIRRQAFFQFELFDIITNH